MKRCLPIFLMISLCLTSLVCAYTEAQEKEPLAALYENRQLEAEELLEISHKMLEDRVVVGPATYWAACMRAEKSLIAFCLAHGASVDVGYVDSISPLSALCLHTPQSPYLKSKEKAEAQAIQKELDKNIRECVLYLLDQGASIHGSEGDFTTPLHAASCAGNTEIMTLLLERGADIHQTASNDFTPLHSVCAHLPNLRAVKFLIAHGANINQRCSFGGTPLMLACLSGDSEIVPYLLEQGADASAWSIAITEDNCDLIACGSGEYYPPAPTFLYTFLPPFLDNPISTANIGHVFKALSFAEQATYVFLFFCIVALALTLVILFLLLTFKILSFFARILRSRRSAHSD